MKKFNWRFKIGRDKDELEKAVTPAIIYINTNHEALGDLRLHGFMITIGWWDFSVKFGLMID